MTGNTEVENATTARGRVKFLFVLQTSFGLFYLGCTLFLLYLITTPHVRRGYDPASAVYGLRIGMVVCGMLAAFTLTSALGLRKKKIWAYRLGASIAWLITAALAFGVWDDKTVDWEMVWMMLPYLAIGIFFLLPGTRLQMRVPALTNTSRFQDLN
jgi:hypothetical protein